MTRALPTFTVDDDPAEFLADYLRHVPAACTSDCGDDRVTQDLSGWALAISSYIVVVDLNRSEEDNAVRAGRVLLDSENDVYALVQFDTIIETEMLSKQFVRMSVSLD